MSGICLPVFLSNQANNVGSSTNSFAFLSAIFFCSIKVETFSAYLNINWPDEHMSQDGPWVCQSNSPFCVNCDGRMAFQQCLIAKSVPCQSNHNLHFTGYDKKICIWKGFLIHILWNNFLVSRITLPSNFFQAKSRSEFESGMGRQE